MSSTSAVTAMLLLPVLRDVVGHVGGDGCKQADDDDGDQQPPLEHRLQAGAKIDAAA